MKIHPPIVLNILRKDWLGLMPLIMLTAILFVAEATLAELDLANLRELSLLLQTYLPWLCYFSSGVLTIAVFQQDPASSLCHDWLVRPISKLDLILAKTLFLFTTIYLPLACARFIVNLVNGYSLIESFLEATFIETSWTLLVIPCLIIFSLLSRSLLQTFAVAMAAFIGLLVVATLPNMLERNIDALGSETTLSSVDWLIGYLLALLIYGTTVAVYWLQFRARKFMHARIVFGGSILLGGVIIIGLMNLPSWPVAFALQRAVVSQPNVEFQESLTLQTTAACFPASVLGMNGAAGAEESGQETVGAAYWPRSFFDRAGRGAISFAATVGMRGVPRGWRVFPLKVTANYTADSLGEELALLPSGNANASPVDTETNAATNFWLVPGDSSELLRSDPSTSLRFDYSLALLSPSTHEVPMDGNRRHYAGLGFCSAELDPIQNLAELQCFKRGLQPALVSAELMYIPASRVDSGRPNFTPAWLQLLDGQHYEISVPSPSLVDSNSLLVTSYKMEGFFEKEYSSEGIVGDSLATCPLLTNSFAQESSWSDKSPHESSYVTVADELRLEVLDWGGTGKTVLLLPGGGATAHSYDNIAPRLAEHYRVIGITRRGFGASSRPDYGYEIERLSHDVLDVMDSLDLEEVVLVGHSLAGHELSLLGSEHPDRFSALIYLDAGYDNSGDHSGEAEYNIYLPPNPSPTPAELGSYQALQSYIQRIGGLALPEGEIMAMIDFATGRRIIDRRIADATMAGLDPQPYGQISQPVLSIYAVEGAQADDYVRPWFDPDDPYVLPAAKALQELRSAFQREQIENFRAQVGEAQIIVLEDSDHWVFVANEEEVFAAMTEFISQL